MDFARVIIVALNAKDHPVHHSVQSATARQFVGRKETQEMTEVAALNLVAAELVEDDVFGHAVCEPTGLHASVRFDLRAW
jgi:hypothetical protein